MTREEIIERLHGLCASLPPHWRYANYADLLFDALSAAEETKSKTLVLELVIVLRRADNQTIRAELSELLPEVAQWLQEPPAVGESYRGAVDEIVQNLPEPTPRGSDGVSVPRGRPRGGGVTRRGGPAPSPPAAALPGTITRTPHIDVDAPEELTVGAKFAVQVYLDTEGLKVGEHGSILDLPNTEELWLDVELTTSPHFVIEGTSRGKIVVRASKARSSPAAFNLKCVASDGTQAVVAATFTNDWRPAGYVWRELSVGANHNLVVAAGHALPEATVVVDPDARPPDLMVRVSPSPDGDERHYHITASSRHLPGEHIKIPWNLRAATRDVVAGYMDSFVRSDPGGRKAALITAGMDLFDATPPEFREFFWTLADDSVKKLETILVVTSEPFIPWELMVPNKGPMDVRRPLGVDYAVGRHVHPSLTSPAQALPITESWVIAPNYRGDKKLTFSADEARLVADSFNGDCISPALILTIDQALANRGASLLHFVCHGLSGAGTQILYLDQDQQLAENQLSGMEGLRQAVAKYQPLVFINACQVGQVTPSLVGSGGFAARFTKLGARCVIAPIWSVKDSVAGAVARDFYTRIRAQPGLPFAKALQDIRKRAYEGDDPEDSYAAYCLFGDPLAAAQH